MIRHKRTNIDLEAMTAICDPCGPVRLKYNKTWFECMPPDTPRRSSPKHFLDFDSVDEETRMAVCRACGLVPIIRHRKSWRCALSNTTSIPGMNVGEARDLKQKVGKCENPGCGSAVRRLHVDHSHEDGRVRGVLCSTCNQALGLLGEDRDRILGLLKYLDKVES